MIKKQISFFIKDTYAGSINDPLSLNLYTYCVNNPLMYYDPTGHKPVGRQGMPNDLWVKTQGMIIDRKMNFDKDAENIELGSYRLEAESMLYLQDELLIHGQQALEVIGEQVRENRALYFKTHDKRYLKVLKSNYNELNTMVQTYSKYGFEIYNFEFVKDDNYYKTLYSTYHQEDGFTRWLYLDRNKHTLFSEGVSALNTGAQMCVMGKMFSMNSNYQNNNNNLSSLDIENSRFDRMEYNAITGNVDKPTNSVPMKSYFNELEGWSINRQAPEPVGEPRVFDSPVAGDNIGFSKTGVGGGKPGSYAPNRELPRTKHGDPIPDTDAPHTQLGQRDDGYGPYNQARTWETNPNGKGVTATKDIDFSDHMSPDVHPDPHQHTLTPANPKLAPKGGYHRGPAEPLVQ